MTEETLKGFSFDKLFDLLVKTTKELKLASTNDETEIQSMKGQMLLLRRIMVAKWVEKI